MAPISFALAVTLPIVGISLLVWLWVRRSATPEIAARRRKLLYTIWITFCVVALSWKLIVGSRLYRSIVGIATITFANKSEMPLQDVVIVTRWADGRRDTNHVASLSARGSWRLAVRTSELMLESITCLQGAQHLAYTNGGLATRGRTLEAGLDSAGEFSSIHK